MKMLAVLGLVVAWVRPTDLTFVRHGETVANATGHYNARTLNEFSSKGAAGVAAVTKQLLSQPRFDVILVSPSPRALKTIAPYLRATHSRAIIWPLAYECCTGKKPKDAHPTEFKWGSALSIPNDIANLFIVEKGAGRLPSSPDYNSGLAQVDASLGEFKARFLGKRVLIVGHSGHGGQFLHSLTGKWRRVENTKEIEVQLP
jgi:broad specificity phosphatase PhoE